MVDSAWNPDDKEWLKQRKAQWLILKKNSLDVNTWFRQKDFKQLRNYYLTGEEDVNNALPFYTKGKSNIKYPVPVFIKLWFYPEPSVEDLRALLQQTPTTDVRDCYSSVGSMASLHFKTDYGMMGGREELIIKALYGDSFDEYKSIWLSLIGEDKTDIAYANNVTFASELPRWLSVGYPVYVPTQYMLEHWCESLPYRTNLDEREDMLIWFMYKVAFFKDPLGLAPEDSRYFKVAETLRDMFENRPMPAYMKDLWKKVKSKEVELPEFYRDW